MAIFQGICTFIVVLALILGAAFGIGWWHAGYKAERLTELTGQPVSQSDVFWCGSSIVYQPTED